LLPLDPFAHGFREAHGLGPLVDQADAYAEAGVDLFVVYLQPPLQPSVVEQVATVLSR